jgi:hypothetical protein
MDAKLSPLDFKFHFFPWWEAPEYRLEPDGLGIPEEFARYFARLEEQGIALDAAQKAWYVKNTMAAAVQFMIAARVTASRAHRRPVRHFWARARRRGGQAQSARCCDLAEITAAFAGGVDQADGVAL